MGAIDEEILEIRPHDHLCLIYERESEWRPAVLGFLASGLKRGEKCIYISGAYSSDYVRKHLTHKGIDVEAKEKKGQLEFVADQNRSRPLHLKPDFIRPSVEGIGSEGYSALRITGEVTALDEGNHKAVGDILEQELEEDLFLQYPLSVLCRYNLNDFSPALLQRVIRVHPYIIWQQSVQENPIYLPPEELQLKEGDSKAKVRGWLNKIQEFNGIKKRYQTKLKKTKNQLRQRNKELKELLYITSHDLRSPLINVQGFSQEIKNSLAEAEEVLEPLIDKEPQLADLKTILQQNIAESIGYILKSATKMDNLLTGLLKLSRISHESISLRKVDINQLVTEVTNDFQYRLQQKQAEIKIDGALPDCIGDKGQLNRVFTNLIDNAVKYLPPKSEGRIEISGWQEGENVVYSIADNGVGIEKEDQAEVFLIFNRGTADKATPGEGLGLAIVKRIINLHDGEIWLESSPGVGTEFFFTLPAVE